MVRTNNTLDTQQTIQLVDWFRANKKTIAERQLGKVEVAAMAAKELGFAITNNNVTRIAGQGEKCAIQFRWPYGSGPRRGGTRIDPRLKLIAEVIEDLRMAIGHNFEGELGRRWYALCKELDSVSSAQAIAVA